MKTKHPLAEFAGILGQDDAFQAPERQLTKHEAGLEAAIMAFATSSIDSMVREKITNAVEAYLSATATPDKQVGDLV
jgi:acetyl-CoA carboxylase beta subunit